MGWQTEGPYNNQPLFFFKSSPPKDEQPSLKTNFFGQYDFDVLPKLVVS